MKRTSAAVLVLAVLAVSGCESGNPAEGASSPGAESTSPAAAPTDAPQQDDERPELDAKVLDRFEQVRSEFGALEGVQIEATRDGTENLTAHGRVNLVTGDYEATTPLDDDTQVEVRHVGDLTWVRAPEEYWVASGFTTESSSAAVGKWVLAEPKTGPMIEQQYSPGALVARLRAVDLAEVTETEAGAESMSLTLETDGGSLEVAFTAGGPPRIVSVSAVTEDQPANHTEFVGYPQDVSVAVPDAGEVLRADATEN